LASGEAPKVGDGSRITPEQSRSGYQPLRLLATSHQSNEAIAASSFEYVVTNASPRGG
jgi:hypothetical protein